MIKNLLFDLGGVIMNIERRRCVEAYERLGMKNVSDFLGDYAQKGPFAQLEEGQISADEFRAEMRRYLPAGVTDEQIDSALMQFLVGIPRHRLEELRKLHERYHIYMLSNTNPIMWNGFIASEFKAEGLTVNDYFDGIVTSFDAKVMKPDERIFKVVEEKLGVRPSETLFLDDSEKNLQAAARLGFKTLHVPTDTEFYTLIKAYEAAHGSK